MKKSPLNKRKKTPLAKLKAKADRTLSMAVRLRDTGKDGYGECITCQKRIHYTAGHAGHFMSRRFNGTRFDPLNVNLQCPGCNTFNHGEQYKYGIALDLKYGSGTAKSLHDKAMVTYKLTTEFLEKVIADAELEIMD